MDQLGFRPFTRDDKQGLSRVVHNVLGVDHNDAYWEWKYFQNPAGEHMVIVAVSDNGIVGVQGYLPARLKCGSKVMLSAQNTDMAVLAQHRTGGTFLRLHEKAMDYGPRRRRALCYGFPNEIAFRFAPCLEYIEICPVFNLTKVLNPAPYFHKKLRFGFPEQISSCIKKVSSWLYTKAYLCRDFGVTEIRVFDARFDAFWQKEARHYPIATIRDREYLNWRYVGSPHTYKIFCVEIDSMIKGFVVLRCVQDGQIKRGKIVDILVEWDQHAIGETLIKSSVQYFADRKVDVITCWIFDHWPIFHVFRKMGFVKRQAPHHLVVNSQAVDIPKEVFCDVSKWYVTMGDSDYC